VFLRCWLGIHRWCGVFRNDCRYMLRCERCGSLIERTEHWLTHGRERWRYLEELPEDSRPWYTTV